MINKKKFIINEKEIGIKNLFQFIFNDLFNQIKFYKNIIEYLKI